MVLFYPLSVIGKSAKSLLDLVLLNIDYQRADFISFDKADSG